MDEAGEFAVEEVKRAVVAVDELFAEVFGFGTDAVALVGFAQVCPDEEGAWVGGGGEFGDDAVDFVGGGVLMGFLEGVAVGVDDFEAFEGAVLLGECGGVGDDGDGSVAGGLEVGGDGFLFGGKAGAP